MTRVCHLHREPHVAHNFASHQMDFVRDVPMVVSDAPEHPAIPASVQGVMVAYMQGFAQALTTTFGMGERLPDGRDLRVIGG